MAEDRSEDTSLRLALLSLRAQCPGVPLTLFRPDASTEFRRWLRAFPQVTLVDQRLSGATSWNCKPHVLLALLDQGCDEVVWLDSDLAFARPFTYLFDRRPADTLVVAEDMQFAVPRGTLARTTEWQLPVGKVYPTTINSCVLRVTPSHRPLLSRWCELMGAPEYREAQAAEYWAPRSSRTSRCTSCAVGATSSIAAAVAAVTRRGNACADCSRPSPPSSTTCRH